MNIQTDRHAGTRIKHARVAAGHTINWLARQLSNANGHPIRQVELRLLQLEDDYSDSKSIHATELAAIAKALGCSLLKLMGVEDG